MKEAMDKIIQVVDSDKKSYIYKFLGLYKVEFKEAMKIVFLIQLSFVPSLFNK